MEYTEVDISVENLKTQHALLDEAIREEEQHIWKNMIKIEQLKKEKLRKKGCFVEKKLAN